MDPTVKALTELLLRAVPTIFFLVLLTIYLKYVFFKPLERVLEKRHQQTEGVRKLAEKALASADHKASEFDRLLTAAKTELYREQEAQRHRWLAEQSRVLAEARRQAKCASKKPAANWPWKASAPPRKWPRRPGNWPSR